MGKLLLCALVAAAVGGAAAYRSKHAPPKSRKSGRHQASKLCSRCGVRDNGSSNSLGQASSCSACGSKPPGPDAADSGKSCLYGVELKGLPSLVGNTALVRINSLSDATGCEIYAKAEWQNPGGSSKDRVALQIILDAMEAGQLKPGGTIVEGTSGNTGISLALLSRAFGFECKVFMPDDQAKEKSDLLTMYGVDVQRVKNVSIVNSAHYVNLARRYGLDNENAFFTDQFENLSNFRAHYRTTGPEIWKQTSGTVDAFVMGSGTGGTIAGVSRYLKDQKPETQVFLVDPPGSSMYHKVEHGVCYAPQQAESKLRRHRYDTIIEGVGIDRVTANFDEAAIDRAFRCTDQEAVEMSRYLLRNDGIFAGSSSSMNLVGAVKAARMLGPGRTIVTLLCDSGSRHLTRLWNNEFLESKGLTPLCGGTALDFVK